MTARRAAGRASPITAAPRCAITKALERVAPLGLLSGCVLRCVTCLLPPLQAEFACTPLNRARAPCNIRRAAVPRARQGPILSLSGPGWLVPYVASPAARLPVGTFARAPVRRPFVSLSGRWSSNAGCSHKPTRRARAMLSAPRWPASHDLRCPRPVRSGCSTCGGPGGDAQRAYMRARRHSPCSWLSVRLGLVSAVSFGEHFQDVDQA